MNSIHRSYASLPTLVLEHVFSYLTVSELFHASNVCKSWQTIIIYIHFWLRKKYQFGNYNLNCPELKAKLMESQLDQSEILRFLQGIGLYNKNRLLFQKYFGGRIIDNEDSILNVNEKDIIAASVQLLFHEFLKVSLCLYSDLSNIKYINIILLVLSYKSNCKVKIIDHYSWRNQCISSNHILKFLNSSKNCREITLCTALSKVEVLQDTVVNLRLGLLADCTKENVVKDPGIAHLRQYCPKLMDLSIHVKAGMVIHNISRIPEFVLYPMLYISEMSHNSHIKWAVDLASKLKPSRGYHALYFPSCKLKTGQLCTLMDMLGCALINIKPNWKPTRQKAGYYISSPHNHKEHLQVCDSRFVRGKITWYQQDKKLHCSYTGW